MLAVRYHRNGPPEVLVAEQVPDPEPGPGQVLVEVRAAGVNFADTLIRAGAPGSPPIPLPFTPGFEVAGTIVAVGADVDNGRVGQRVVASTLGGGYAEFAAVTAVAALPIPESLDDQTAAALLVQGSTALGIINVARIESGDTVLVEAAAGGVGTLLLQLAKASGARVIAVAGGEHKLTVAEKAGADVAIDYTATDWPDRVREAGGGDIQVVLDTVGGAMSGQALQLLAPITGRMVLCGTTAGAPLIDAFDVLRRNVTIIGYSSAVLPPEDRGVRAARAIELGARGDLQPVIGSVLPLEQAAEAHRALENRETVGKVILTT